MKKYKENSPTAWYNLGKLFFLLQTKSFFGWFLGELDKAIRYFIEPLIPNDISHSLINAIIAKAFVYILSQEYDLSSKSSLDYLLGIN